MITAEQQLGDCGVRSRWERILADKRTPTDTHIHIDSIDKAWTSVHSVIQRLKRNTSDIVSGVRFWGFQCLKRVGITRHESFSHWFIHLAAFRMNYLHHQESRHCHHRHPEDQWYRLRRCLSVPGDQGYHFCSCQPLEEDVDVRNG